MPRYFLLYAIAFWIPILILTPLVLPRVPPAMRKAFWLNQFIFCWPLSFAMEYIYLYYDVWDFSEAWDPLLGIRIMGAPIEEFVFWFGAPWIITIVYLGIDLLMKRKRHA